MPLIRNFQFVAKIEDQWATPDIEAALFTAANASYLPSETPTITFAPEIVERTITQGTLTPAKGIIGLRTGNTHLVHELLSSTTGYTLAPLLRSCGLLQVSVVKMEVGAIEKNGNPAYLKHGTKVYYGTAAAVPATQYMTIMGDYYDGDTVVFAAYDNTGDLNYRDFLWKAGAGGATAPQAADKVTDDDTETALTETSFTIADIELDGGQAFCPVSRPLHRLSVPSGAGAVSVTRGDILVGQTSGSRWQVVHDTTVGVGIQAILTVVNIIGHLTAGEALHDETNADTNLGVVEATVDLAEKQLAGASIGIGVWKDGVREAISSARGNVSFSFPVGKPALVTFDHQGVQSILADAAGLTGITYPDLLPPIFQNTSLTVGEDLGLLAADEYSPCIAAIELNLGNEINQRQCSNAEFGVLEYEITGRSPTGSIDPELYHESVFATMGNFLDDVNGRVFFSFARPTAEAHNKFWFWLPSIGVTAIETGDRNGRATRQISFAPNTGTAGFVQREVDNDFVLIMDNKPLEFV